MTDNGQAFNSPFKVKRSKEVLTCTDYNVAWICALRDTELLAVRLILDEEYTTPPFDAQYDRNTYVCGRVGEHRVVIACLPSGRSGNTNASHLTGPMFSTFPNIKITLLVGIGGGVPLKSPRDVLEDVYLGDVVVGWPGDGTPAIIQYGAGRWKVDGVFEQRGSVDQPDWHITQALDILISNHDLGQTGFGNHLHRLSKHPKFLSPSSDDDRLFQADYKHKGSYFSGCKDCLSDKLVTRPKHSEARPQLFRIHQGTIASGEAVIQDGEMRDRLSKECNDARCLETEAVGVNLNSRCLIIRGVANYADSHKNDLWKFQAAGNAAVFAKELLLIMNAVELKDLKGIISDETTPLSYFLIPFPRNESFVGRDSQLKELVARLDTDQFCRRVAVWGLGGVGKTQIVIKFAYNMRKTSPECSIFWVYANTTASFERSYADIAECLDLPGRMDQNSNIKLLVKAALSQIGRGQWLLIIDNADDIDVLSKKNVSESVALVDYLPDSPLGSIVFTTRTRKTAVSLAKNNLIQVDKISRDDAIKVLEKTLIRTSLLADENTVVKFLETLCYFPLAITQAVFYINKNDVSITEYTDLCEGSEEDLLEVLSRDFEDEGRYKDTINPVATTWLISFRQICRHDSLAEEYLSFMACLVRQNIPQSLLPIASKARTKDVIGTLTAYSFVTKHKSDDLFDMHRLVHIAIKNWLKQKNTWRSWNQKALQRMDHVFPWPQHENKILWTKYFPHAQNIIMSIDSLNGVDASWKLLHNLAECYGKTGNYSKSEAMYRQTLQLREKVLGKEHPDTLASMNNLANSLRQQGKFPEAEAMDRQTLQLKEKVLGKKHINTSVNINQVNQEPKPVILEQNRRGKRQRFKQFFLK